MKGKKLLAGILSAAMLLGTVSFSAFADGETEQKLLLTGEEFTVQRNSTTEYTSDTVVYEVDGKVAIDGDKEEWTNVLNASAAGVSNVKTVKFVGTTENAEINIKKGPAILAWQGHALNVEFKNLTLSNSDPQWAGDIAHASKFFTTFLRCTDAENCSVKYTDCKFTNGVGNNQYGKTVFERCTFEKDNANYAIWIYGNAGTKVDILDSHFTGKRGVKVYSEDGSGNAFISTKISGCTFSGITDKPAIVSSISGNIEVEDTTFENCSKGLVENSGKEWNNHTPLANITIDGKEPVYTYTANGNLYTYSDYGKAEGESLANVDCLQIPNPGTPKARTANAAFTSLGDAVAAAQDGDTITLFTDVAILPQGEGENLVPQITIGKSLTLDLAGHTIGYDKSVASDNLSYYPVFFAVPAGVDVTITGNGTIDCEAGSNGAYGINVNGGNLTIENGTFYGGMTAVQVQKGSLNVNGGYFDLTETVKRIRPDYAKYVINAIDAYFKDGTAKISVTGGTFVNFDPSADPEGAGTSYVAVG